MSNDKKTECKEYIWPALMGAASVANIAGQYASLASGGSNDTPAFKTGLATSVLYAGANAFRIVQICQQREAEAEAERVAQELRAEDLELGEDSLVVSEVSSNQPITPVSPPSPSSFAEREQERRANKTEREV